MTGPESILAIAAVGGVLYGLWRFYGMVLDGIEEHRARKRYEADARRARALENGLPPVPDGDWSWPEGCPWTDEPQDWQPQDWLAAREVRLTALRQRDKQTPLERQSQVLAHGIEGQVH